MTVQCNSEIDDYLVITLNLNDGTYHPYRKSNEETKYIGVNSTINCKKDSQICHYQKNF